MKMLATACRVVLLTSGSALAACHTRAYSARIETI